MIFVGSQLLSSFSPSRTFSLRMTCYFSLQPTGKQLQKPTVVQPVHLTKLFIKIGNRPNELGNQIVYNASKVVLRQTTAKLLV